MLDASESPSICDKTVAAQLWRAAARCRLSRRSATAFSRSCTAPRAQTKFASGTRGQGILLVDGDLELVGGFEWTGLILVRGQMKITGTGNKIKGAILTEGVDVLTAGGIGGNAEVTFSKCAIDRAVNGAAQPAPVSRGWAQLY